MSNDNETKKNELAAAFVKNPSLLARALEHSVLAPDAAESDIIDGCDLARRLQAGVMMVQPSMLALAVRELEGTEVIPASVLAFPHGTATPEAKAFEAAKLAGLGARELDMVMNVGLFKSLRYRAVEDDIRGVVDACRVPVKVILETALLDDDEIIRACQICEKAGAYYVKTSTGFSKGGATAEHVALMRRSVSERVSVKASGGIRTLDVALTMIAAGASRIGTSSTAAIMTELGEWRAR